MNSYFHDSDTIHLPAFTELQIRRHGDAILDVLGPRCRRCHYPLHAPESVRLGIGPKCRRRALT